MSLIVQKYGGTSVADNERIDSVARRIKMFKEAGNDVVVSVSAMSGETNRLLALARSIQAEPDSRELDMLLATGEQVSIALLSMALKNIGCDAISCTGAQVKILTDSIHGKARIQRIDEQPIRNALKQGKVVIVAGFQGVDNEGNITTLGRGGSDTTAVALAAALKADECSIYTDVDGVYTADPRVVPNAKKIDALCYEEMLEMASLGSKVLQIRAVEFASKYVVPLRVLSSLVENPIGTLITNEEHIMEGTVISAIAHSKDEAKMSLMGVPDTPGVAAKILGAISQANIEVDVIVQSVSAREGMTNFAFTVNREDYLKASRIMEQLSDELSAIGTQNDDKVSKVSLVGVGMRSNAGIAAKMFEILYQENINIEMVSTSEIKVSVIIDEKYLELAVRSLHAGFELDK